MSKYSEENILSFLEEIAGHKNMTSQTDIFSELRVSGDDFDEMILEYKNRFNVDMTEYLWYFHTDEEGHSLGGSFIKSPNERVTRIPVTPKMLLDFANNGKWTIEYPHHRIPKIRFDLILSIILVLGLICFIFYLKHQQFS